MKELTFSYLLRLALRRWVILLAAFVIFAGAAFGYCRYIAEPSYAAKTSLMITSGGMLFGSNPDQQSGAGINNEFNLSVSMMDTYVEYLREPEIYNELADKWHEDFPNEPEYSGGTLRSCAKISARGEETFFLDIVFTTSDPHLSARLAKRFSDCAQKNLEYVFPSVQAEKTRILTDDSVGARTGPNTRLITILVGFVGLILCYVAVLIIDLTDHAIAGEEGYTAHFKIPLLGAVPYFETDVAVGTHNNRGGYYYSEYGKNK